MEKPIAETVNEMSRDLTVLKEETDKTTKTVIVFLVPGCQLESSLYSATYTTTSFDLNDGHTPGYRRTLCV